VPEVQGCCNLQRGPAHLEPHGLPNNCAVEHHAWPRADIAMNDLHLRARGREAAADASRAGCRQLQALCGAALAF
jgi:hypothetical protein